MTLTRRLGSDSDPNPSLMQGLDRGMQFHNSPNSICQQSKASLCFMRAAVQQSAERLESERKTPC